MAIHPPVSTVVNQKVSFTQALAELKELVRNTTDQTHYDLLANAANLHMQAHCFVNWASDVAASNEVKAYFASRDIYADGAKELQPEQAADEKKSNFRISWF